MANNKKLMFKDVYLTFEPNAYESRACALTIYMPRSDSVEQPTPLEVEQWLLEPNTLKEYANLEGFQDTVCFGASVEKTVKQPFQERIRFQAYPRT
jgi:hypothetical protein